MKPEDYLRGGTVTVWQETFAIVKSKRTLPDAFANIADRNEITVVVDQTKVREEDIIEIERGWKLLSFDMVLPFALIGFLAAVSQALAEAGVSLFALSAYSTDHILVKEDDLSRARGQLERLGCIVKESI